MFVVIVYWLRITSVLRLCLVILAICCCWCILLVVYWFVDLTLCIYVIVLRCCLVFICDLFDWVVCFDVACFLLVCCFGYGSCVALWCCFGFSYLCSLSCCLWFCLSGFIMCLRFVVVIIWFDGSSGGLGCFDWFRLFVRLIWLVCDCGLIADWVCVILLCSFLCLLFWGFTVWLL